MNRAWVALLTIGFSSAVATGKPAQSALDQYRKLQCEPRSVAVQSVEPLRFAATATCYKLPKSFDHEGWLQLVAVDVDAGLVRLVDLGGDDHAWRTLQDDGHGGLRWLQRSRPRPDQSRDLEAWVLPSSTTQPSLIGRVELPFALDNNLRATQGERCMLLGGGPLKHALLKFSDSGLTVQPVEGLRGVRLWHAEHRAFVVQTDPNSLSVHELLDCDGRLRPVPEPDASRFAAFPRQDIVISSRGDWLVHVESHDGDEIVILQGDHRRSYGPFEWTLDDCPDVCDGVGLPLFNPGWSPNGQVFIAHGLFESMVVNATNLKPVFTWKYRDNTVAKHTLLLSESLAMELSKKRGVIFHRW